MMIPWWAAYLAIGLAVSLLFELMDRPFGSEWRLAIKQTVITTLFWPGVFAFLIIWG
jgi:hypothetical protein